METGRAGCCGVRATPLGPHSPPDVTPVSGSKLCSRGSEVECQPLCQPLVAFCHELPTSFPLPSTVLASDVTAGRGRAATLGRHLERHGVRTPRAAPQAVDRRHLGHPTPRRPRRACSSWPSKLSAGRAGDGPGQGPGGHQLPLHSHTPGAGPLQPGQPHPSAGEPTDKARPLGTWACRARRGICPQTRGTWCHHAARAPPAGSPSLGSPRWNPPARALSPGCRPAACSGRSESAVVTEEEAGSLVKCELSSVP